MVFMIHFAYKCIFKCSGGLGLWEFETFPIGLNGLLTKKKKKSIT